MADPFIGEIRMMPYNFTQEGWLLCNGGILSIADYTALYSILSDTFGGNGHSTFGLPDLRGRIPVHTGSTIQWGYFGGYNTVLLNEAQMPAHSHELMVSAEDADADTPSDKTSLAIAGNSTNVYAPYTTQNDLVAMEHDISSVGDSQAHMNMQPYQAIGFFIAYEGLYPSRN